jgi:hypothetical protein
MKGWVGTAWNTNKRERLSKIDLLNDFRIVKERYSIEY